VLGVVALIARAPFTQSRTATSGIVVTQIVDRDALRVTRVTKTKRLRASRVCSRPIGLSMQNAPHHRNAHARHRK
jgi:hypothetical protein